MLGISTAVKNAILSVVRSAIDASQSAPGVIKIYTAPVPNPPGSQITTQLLLATLTFSSPCGTVNNGVLTFNTILDEPTAPNTGTAAWARILDGSGNWIADVTVGTSNADIILNSVDIVQGGTVRILSGSISVGV